MTTDDHKTGQPWSARPAVIAIVVSGVLFLGLLFGFRAFVLHPFSVPSESCVPNLMPGDYFFVSKSAYRFGDPQRGDIAVFRLPKDPGIDYVKRVIGLPGDRIQMIGGVLCDQLAFRQPGVDWQICIERGKAPLPRKLVVTGTGGDAAQPVRRSILTWKAGTAPEAVAFTFAPPKGATRIAINEASK